MENISQFTLQVGILVQSRLRDYDVRVEANVVRITNNLGVSSVFPTYLLFASRSILQAASDICHAVATGKPVGSEDDIK